MNVIQKKATKLRKNGDTDVWHVWKNLDENPVNGPACLLKTASIFLQHSMYVA